MTNNRLDILNLLPQMLSGDALKNALKVYPAFDDAIAQMPQALRLMRLSQLYDIFVPSRMAEEIYSKLYLAMLRSLQKKETADATAQSYENHRALCGLNYRGIIGGADSFTIIGTSGIGKSTAVSRALSLIEQRGIIEVETPYQKLIPCIVIQCPYDSSVKGMLLEILRKVDEVLDSKYYASALRARATTDMLIGTVSQVALNHIGLLLVDEIQNVANSKNGKSLIGALTQLINNSGISIGMIGTPESAVFFEQAAHLARRSVGLNFSAMPYDDEFKEFCHTVYAYQYVKNPSALTEKELLWLYGHSAGVVSVVVTLIHDAQEIAIISGTERLDIETLNLAYEQRLSMLHSYINPPVTPKRSVSSSHGKKTDAQKMPKQDVSAVDTSEDLIQRMVAKSKEENLDIVPLLAKHISVTEVQI